MFGVVVGIQGRPAGQHSRTEPRGQDEKGAMAGTRMEPRRQTMARSLWICPRRPARRQGRDKKTTKEDKRTERQTEGGMGGSGGEGTGRDIPSRRVSPFTLLSYKWGYHSRWLQGRRGGGFFLSGGRVVMEGRRRIKGAGSCQGKRDGSGKTGTDLNGRHLLGYAGCFFFFPRFSLLRGKLGERGGGR